MAAMYGLPRASRLKRRHLIRPLFDRTRDDVWSVAHGCIRLILRQVPRCEADSEAPFLVGFSPGRSIRGAVSRNRIKRQMREAFRHCQPPLRERLLKASYTLTLMVLFRGKPEQAPFCIARDLPEAVQKALDQLN